MQKRMITWQCAHVGLLPCADCRCAYGIHAVRLPWQRYARMCVCVASGRPTVLPCCSHQLLLPTLMSEVQHQSSLQQSSRMSTESQPLDETYEAILDVSSAISQLRKLKKQELIELAGRTVKQLAQVSADPEANNSPRYVVEPPRCGPRLGNKDYKRAVQVTAKWTPKKTRKAGHNIANLGAFQHGRARSLVWVNGSWQLVYTQLYMPHKHLFEVINSALLVYRICCLFPIGVNVLGPEAYKLVWETTDLVHNATGAAVSFSEWKGGAIVCISNLNPPQHFLDDVLELLNLLCSPKCPHPYDGTVAGSLA